MGDATVNNEDILMKRYNLPKIDILKVGHHGSRTSSSNYLLKILNLKSVLYLVVKIISIIYLIWMLSKD